MHLTIWVRLADWEVVDGEVEEPTPGAVMRSTALVLDGRSVPLGADVFEGETVADVVLADDPSSASPLVPEYVITGMVEQAEDVSADYGRGSVHQGARLLMRVAGWRLYADVAGWAKDFNPRSRIPVRVTGALGFVGSYEWDAFGLTDIRSDWSVVEVTHLPDSDLLLNVRPADQ